MKKLMIGFAAAGLCAAVFADVTSANVVGYNGFTITPGETTYFVGSFESITSNGKITLGQIIPTEEWAWWNNDMISTVNSLGVQQENYTYNEGNWYVCDEAGTPEGDPVDDLELDLNIGVVVYSTDCSYLQFSGAVPAGECQFNIVPGETTYTGNFTPAPLVIGDIVPDENWAWWNNDMISTINSLGVQLENYTYSDGDWYVCDEAGTPEGEPINNDVSFDPNQGFVIYSTDSTELNFPSPLN